MPHNFVRFPADRPNPGRWNRGEVQRACRDAGGTLEHLWFDDPSSPTTAYALARDGDGEQLRRALQGDELIVLHEQNDRD